MKPMQTGLTKDFLFELGTEELPPRSLESMSIAFSESFSRLLSENSLEYESIESFATPRRIAIFIKKLDTHQPEQKIEKKGPSLKAAFDANNKPSKAGLGFAKSVGVDFNQLEHTSTEKGTWLTFQSLLPGKQSLELLPALISKALQQIPIGKAMRWGTELHHFIRPVHWLIGLFGDEILKLNLYGVHAGRETFGHRFLSTDPIEISTPSEYLPVLEEKFFVIPSFRKRLEKIRREALSLAKKENSTLIMNEHLLEEVTALVEWPVALLGTFDPHFLQVPKECLISTMETNQKYFSLKNSQGNLENKFIFISNLASKAPQSVIEGNEKVIRPRLADAAFFYEADKKSTLDCYIPRLKSLLFQKKLGSLWDKSKRLENLVEHIGSQLKLSDTYSLRRAAELSKADLVTLMVGEFPELQGIMGKYYALAGNEKNIVSIAIEEQYLPRFNGDKIPESDIGICLSIADRLDTLVGIFGINQAPTGIKDPFALRRAALGLIRICIEQKIDLDLNKAIEQTLRIYGDIGLLTETKSLVLNFINSRFRSWYQNQNIPTAIIQSIENVSPNNPLDFDQRIHAIKEFIKQPEVEFLAAANKRVKNLLKKSDKKLPANFNNNIATESAEKELAESLRSTKEKLATKLENKNYVEALSELSKLKPNIDAFFEQVMVMVEDESTRNNRLRLLKDLADAFSQIADISIL